VSKAVVSKAVVSKAVVSKAVVSKAVVSKAAQKEGGAMKQIQITKSVRHPRPTAIDLRSPSGRVLPY
jgi:hypothetical protein